ncbi:MAG TPA: FKBP-type peptidyl-prolyl cis-trans isomerase [Allosphingosinicella sp.]|nr:FKBP-type peptidyl-prolyl cis-trans isomerase [Allosphingosinicella sp.]
MSVTAVPIRPLKKGTVARMWIALALLALAAAAFAWFGTRGFQPMRTASGVEVRPLRQGSGETIGDKDVAALHYKLHVGSLAKPVIQDSREQGQPFVTTTQGIYPGFADGLRQMREGGRYVLTLPPGTHEQGPMPPGAPFTPQDALVFEIDILKVEKGAAERYMQMQQLQALQQMQQMQQQGGAGNEALPEASGR